MAINVNGLGFLIISIAMLAEPVFAATDPTRHFFEPGQEWLDTSGNLINCHGGGFLYYNSTYYWFGEYKVHRRSGGHIGVSCYTSIDLFNWKNAGKMLESGSDHSGETGNDLADGCVIERPKVIYNARTRKFVMWFHLELKGQGYRAARAAVAVSDHPTGPYAYLGSFRLDAGHWPINFEQSKRHPPTTQEARDLDDLVRRDFAGGQMSRDMTLFVDDDGSAYQIAASEENQTLHISKLTDDYLRPSGEYVRILVGGANEAPAMFKREGEYYLITSGTTGWAPNAARQAVAPTITGPWKSLGNPCVGPKEQTDLTFHSQAASVLSVAGKPDALIYVGDRWLPHGEPESPYVWLPISFKDGRPIIAWHDRWDLSVFDK